MTVVPNIPQKLYKREILSAIAPWLQRQEIITILGARQTGKTSILKLLRTV